MISRTLLAGVAMLVGLIAAVAVFLAFADLTSPGQSMLVSFAQAAFVFFPGALLGGAIAGRRLWGIAAGIWLAFWLLAAGISFSAHPNAAALFGMWPAMLGSAISVVASIRAGEWLSSKRRSSSPSGAT